MRFADLGGGEGRRLISRGVAQGSVLELVASLRFFYLVPGVCCACVVE